MTTYKLTLTLSDNLAQEAGNAGLLTPEAIERLLRDEVRRRAVDKMFVAADQLAGIELPALTEHEVEAEIAAARASRNAPGANRC